MFNIFHLSLSPSLSLSQFYVTAIQYVFMMPIADTVFCFPATALGSWWFGQLIALSEAISGASLQAAKMLHCALLQLNILMARLLMQHIVVWYVARSLLFHMSILGEAGAETILGWCPFMLSCELSWPSFRVSGSAAVVKDLVMNILRVPLLQHVNGKAGSITPLTKCTRGLRHSRQLNVLLSFFHFVEEKSNWHQMGWNNKILRKIWKDHIIP